MAAERHGSHWSTKADLTVTNAVTLAYTVDSKLGEALSTTMGHYCAFRMDGGTDADYTYDFDFPILGDFMIVLNPTGADLGSGTTIDCTVQGSADGTNYVDLHTDIIDDGAIDDAMVTAVYDADAKGIMPFMRLELTSVSNHVDEAMIIQIVPMHKAK